MTHYTRTWDCRVCKARQESIDTPRMMTCDDCLMPVAARLCHDVLGVDLQAQGVDRDYWLRRADFFVAPMMERWKEPA